MTLDIELFARMRELVGRDRLQIDIQHGRLDEVRREVVSRFPQTESLLTKSAIAVNECYVGDDVVLKSGDRIAILPPVSGG